MNLLSFAKTKFGLLLLSTTITTVLFVGVFEIVKNIKYYRWKADFDNYGWFGKLTIPSPNPVLMWEYRPNGEINQIKADRYGFRNLDYESAAKPDNTFRIAFAGDSVTLGLGVSREQTFVHQFEIAARQIESQYSIQALNFAVDGYNTPQILEMIRTKVLNFSPDKVVYVMCLNDFDFTQSSGSKIRYFRKPKSFFLSEIEKIHQRFYGDDFHQYHFKKNKNVVFQSILDMREILKQEDISFQVVILPIFPDLPVTLGNYPLLDMHIEIGIFLEQNGIQFFDLREAFTQSGELPRYYASDTWHPNVKGHKFIAKQLLPSILLY
jgi:lysophospholipase L1-like esterase